MKVFFWNLFDLGHQRGIDICTKLCSSKIKLIAKEFGFQILHLILLKETQTWHIPNYSNNRTIYIHNFGKKRRESLLSSLFNKIKRKWFKTKSNKKSRIFFIFKFIFYFLLLEISYEVIISSPRIPSTNIFMEED
jgi:hypothetical protein